MLIELAARSRWGLEALLDWQQNEAVAAKITKRPPEAAAVPGLALHVLHGLLLGLVFVLILPLVPPELPLPIAGLGYGLVLFALTIAVHKPIMGRVAASGRHGSAAIAVALLTHLVYGSLLAVLLVWP